MNHVRSEGLRVHLIQNPFTFLQGQRPCFFCRSVFLLICSWLRKGNSLNITKKSSLEGRNSASGLFRKEDGSLVMKRSAEKNRIQEWLNVNRVQSPLRSSIMDSVETILYDIVNSLYDNNLSDRSENAGAKKQQITIAKGIVTPSVRRELMRLGVKIGEAEQLNNPPKPADILAEDEDVSFSDRVSNSDLLNSESALFIKNTKSANYIDMILSGEKTVETRNTRTLDDFIGREMPVTDGKYVYGYITLGDPEFISAEDFHKPEYQKQHRVPSGDDYDVKNGKGKWAYPIENYRRTEKQKLSDSKDYRYSFQAREVMYSDRNDDLKDASELTEDDFRFLLEKVQNGELNNGSYIPVRANTPQFFIDVVEEHSKHTIRVPNVPMAATVEHLIQNMEEDDGSDYKGKKRPHGLSVDDIVSVSKGMGHPQYIVLQKNGRYAMVVSFFSEKRGKKVIASVSFANEENRDNFKYSKYLNGYKDGYYNIVVTEYEPDSLEHYLDETEIVYDKQKMNGRYQVGSGRVVAVTHDTPFIDSNDILDSNESQEEFFSDRDNTAEETAAEKEFGATKDFNEAGYILADGNLLNFGKDGDRTIDHRAIGKVFGVDVDINVNNGFNEESNKHMISFINSGNIRLEPGGRRPYPSSLVSFFAQ